MRAINIWAWQEALPTIRGFPRVPVCSDGSRSAERLSGPGAPWLAGAGWHLALPFANLHDLAGKLDGLELPDYIAGDPRRLQRGELQTLAIDCHGSPGHFYPNGVARGREITGNNVTQFCGALRGIGLMTASRSHLASDPVPLRTIPPQPTERPASTIIIMACNTGATEAGSRLLMRLSLEWPGRRVVAFSSTVVFPNLLTATDLSTGVQCQPPFALDSGLRHLPGTGEEWIQAELISRHVPPASLPWADATAANAKIACDGQIIATPLNDQPGGGLPRADRRRGLIGPPRRSGRVGF